MATRGILTLMSGRTATRCAHVNAKRWTGGVRRGGGRGVKKDFRIEEQDGLRSDVYKTFDIFDPKTFVKVAFFGFIVPVGLYFGCKAQQVRRGIPFLFRVLTQTCLSRCLPNVRKTRRADFAG